MITRMCGDHIVRYKDVKSLYCTRGTNITNIVYQLYLNNKILKKEMIYCTVVKVEIGQKKGPGGWLFPVGNTTKV